MYPKSGASFAVELVWSRLSYVHSLYFEELLTSQNHAKGEKEWVCGGVEEERERLV